MFRLADHEVLDENTLGKFISRHAAESVFRYRPLLNAYMTDYAIFHEAPKPPWKPDNRIAVNFAKYIVDTMNGFFIGIPIKIACDDKAIAHYVEFLDQYNDQDDNNAELSKICSIYGKGYEMYYVDQEGKIGITYLTPMDAFMIYDDSVLERPLYFVRLYIDTAVYRMMKRCVTLFRKEKSSGKKKGSMVFLGFLLRNIGKTQKEWAFLSLF